MAGKSSIIPPTFQREGCLYESNRERIQQAILGGDADPGVDRRAGLGAGLLLLSQPASTSANASGGGARGSALGPATAGANPGALARIGSASPRRTSATSAQAQ